MENFVNHINFFFWPLLILSWAITFLVLYKKSSFKKSKDEADEAINYYKSCADTTDTQNNYLMKVNKELTSKVKERDLFIKTIKFVSENPPLYSAGDNIGSFVIIKCYLNDFGFDKINMITTEFISKIIDFVSTFKNISEETKALIKNKNRTEFDCNYMYVVYDKDTNESGVVNQADMESYKILLNRINDAVVKPEQMPAKPFLKKQFISV